MTGGTGEYYLHAIMEVNERNEHLEVENEALRSQNRSLSDDLNDLRDTNAKLILSDQYWFNLYQEVVRGRRNDT